MFFDNVASDDAASRSPAATPQSGLPLSRSHRTTTAAATTTQPQQPLSPQPEAAPKPGSPKLDGNLPTPPTTTSAPSVDGSGYEDVPSRQWLIAQCLANTTFLHPASEPTLLTSRDAAGTQQKRIVIVSTRAPTSILFQQAGTGVSSFEALLARTEAAVHERLQELNPEVEGLRSAVDAARLQRENAAMLEALETRRRSEFALQLPRHPVARRAPAHRGLLPKSRAAMTRRTELALPPLDPAGMVSPKTVPAAPVRRGLRPPVSKAARQAAFRWGSEEEVQDQEEMDSIAKWVREVSEAELTPPITPGHAAAAGGGGGAGGSGGLPKSKRFEEGRVPA